MFEEPGHKGSSHLGEVIGTLGVKEGIAVALEEGHMHMHPRAVDAEDGFGHEGGIDPVLLGYLLYRKAVGHDIIGHAEGIGIAQVYLMLAEGYLMVAELHPNAHPL